MSDIQVVIAFGLAGVAIWNLMRIVHRLDQIAAIMKRNGDARHTTTPIE